MIDINFVITNTNIILNDKIKEFHTISNDLDISDPERQELELKAEGIKIALDLINNNFKIINDYLFADRFSLEFDSSKKASLIDSLNLLWDLINCIKSDNIERAKTRIKEYGYIAEPKFIMKLLNSINNNVVQDCSYKEN